MLVRFVGGDLDTGLFNAGLDLPLVDWLSLSARESDFPGLDLVVDGERTDFDGLEEAPSDFELSSFIFGLFGEPVLVFVWLMLPETTSFGLGGFLNFEPSLGNWSKSNKIFDALITFHMLLTQFSINIIQMIKT